MDDSSEEEPTQEAKQNSHHLSNVSKRQPMLNVYHQLGSVGFRRAFQMTFESFRKLDKKLHPLIRHQMPFGATTIGHSTPLSVEKPVSSVATHTRQC